MVPVLEHVLDQRELMLEEGEHVLLRGELARSTARDLTVIRYVVGRDPATRCLLHDLVRIRVTRQPALVVEDPRYVLI